MNAPATAAMLQGLPAEHRQRLMRFAREVPFPQGTQLVEEGGRADRFWIIRTGSVDLDMRVPGRRAAVIEILRPNELIGWSWLFAPHAWHLGAEATTRLRVCTPGGVVQHRVGDAPELESESLLPPGPDDQQVGGGRHLQQKLA